MTACCNCLRKVNSNEPIKPQKWRLSWFKLLFITVSDFWWILLVDSRLISWNFAVIMFSKFSRYLQQRTRKMNVTFPQEYFDFKNSDWALLILSRPPVCLLHIHSFKNSIHDGWQAVAYIEPCRKSTMKLFFGNS